MQFLESHNLENLCLIPAHAERIRDPIDIVEPRGDERNLQDASVVKSDGAQAVMILPRDSGRVFRQLHHKIEHPAVLLADGGSRVIILQRADKLFI
jgi:hypothetical protein